MRHVKGGGSQRLDQGRDERGRDGGEQEGVEDAVADALDQVGGAQGLHKSFSIGWAMFARFWLSAGSSLPFLALMWMGAATVSMNPAIAFAILQCTLHIV